MRGMSTEKISNLIRGEEIAFLIFFSFYRLRKSPDGQTYGWTLVSKSSFATKNQINHKKSFKNTI